jgi:glycosyltransferase involved in cell wall biosynthesis
MTTDCNEKPLISVITAAHNASDHIQECIDAILEQTFQNFELIVINDCSSDNTLEILKHYQQQDSRIKLINNEKNIGPAGSRNLGLQVAQGKYVAIQDADDISLPHRLEIEFNYLENNSEVYLVAADSIIRYEDEMEFTNKSISGIENIKKFLPYRNSIIHSSVMFRNKGDYTYRDKFKYSHDYDLYLQILSDGYNINNINTPLVVYKISKNGISSTKAYYQALFSNKVKEFYRQRIKEGRDGYDSFDPANIFSSKRTSVNLYNKKNYNSENFFLDLIIYQDKLKAIKFIVHHISYNSFTPSYLFKKLVLLALPKSWAKGIKAKNLVR